MLTNNFYLALADEVAGATSNKSNVKNTENTFNTSTSASDYKYLYPFSYGDGSTYPADWSQTSGAGGSRVGLLIGSDNTTPTLDDYKLGNQITTGFTCQLSVQNSNDEIAKAKKFILVLSITNTSSSDLTINELGYVRGCAYKVYLMDRTVFDTPVVIAPGATKTFEYRLNMPQP